MEKTLKTLLANGIDLATIDFSSILSNFHEGIVITDKDGIILYYNSSMGKIDDIEPPNAIGRGLLEIYDLSEQQSTTMRCLRCRQVIQNEPIFYRTHLGKVTNAISNVYPLFNNHKLIGAISYTKDYHMVERIFSTSEPRIHDKPERKNGTRYSFADIIGRNSDLSESVRIAQMAAESPSPVLISGETGTGKELFAQSIHNFSSYSKNPFIPINCAAIPENLLEGILFGTSKGAFTGAIDKGGLFEQANDGTLFLDELNSMPLTLQTKLLRVIQEKKVRRIGSHSETDLNVKIISSVNQDPHQEINRGNLRLDLFYRLGVVFVQIPTLRERKQDLTKLIYHFIEKFNTRLKKNVAGISTEVEEFFLEYHWPGNVRELEHVIEGSMNLIGKNKIIEKPQLPKHFLQVTSNNVVHPKVSKATEGKDYRTPSPSAIDGSPIAISDIHNSLQQLNETYRTAEQSLISRALSSSKGNIAKAAKTLGLSSPQALQYKMKKLNLTRAVFIETDT